MSDETKETRVCKTCKIEKPLIDFEKTALGRLGSCKVCRREKRNAVAQIKQAKIQAGEIIITEKKCSSCQVIQPIENFNKNKSRSDGFDVTCKSCVSKHHKERHAALDDETKQKIAELKREARLKQKLQQQLQTALTVSNEVEGK